MDSVSVSRQITPHFSTAEFRCHDGTEYPMEWIDERLVPLCNVLEKLREALGDLPVRIISGYRSPQHNAAVGGAKASQHMEGRAADISVDGVPPHFVHGVLLQLFSDGKIQIGGLGLYVAWVHVDVRPWQGHLCQWTGTGVGDEQ